MFHTLLRRIAWSIVVLLVVTAATFLIFFAIPTNPASLIAGKYATPATIEKIERDLGLDLPLPIQYLRFVGQAARGNLGYSYVSQQPVALALAQAFPKTLSLTFGAVVVWLLIGIPLGVVSALRPGSIWDRGALVFALLGISAPVYWIGLVLLKVFADSLGWFPLGGYVELTAGGPLAWAHTLVLPWFALAMLYAGWYARMTRSQMLDVAQFDFVRTARAKGLGTYDIVTKHILRNALLPLVTMLGIDIAYLFGGAVLTETVFGIPGIGGLAWRAIRQRDLPMVMGTVIFAAAFIVLANLFVDMLYRWLDPRIREER